MGGGNLSDPEGDIALVTDKGAVLTSDLLLEISRGNVEGATRFAYGGNILDLSSGDGLRDIWNGAGNRTDLAAATSLFISSTDAGDDAVIIILGMDDEFNDIVVIGTLNGQNQVAVSADIWKVFAMSILGTGTVDGAVYLAESDDLTDGVPDNDNKVQLVAPIVGGVASGFGAIAEITIPVGFTAYFTTLKLTPNKGKDVTVYLTSKSPTQSQIVNPAGFELFEYNFDTQFIPYFAIEEKTTVAFKAKTNDENAPVSVLVETFLIQNEL